MVPRQRLRRRRRFTGHSEACEIQWNLYNAIVSRYGTQWDSNPYSHFFEHAYSTLFGCSVVYVKLTAECFEELASKLKGPHFSLDLYDDNVRRLIYQAATSDDCPDAGDRFLLHSLFSNMFYSPKTWSDDLPVEIAPVD